MRIVGVGVDLVEVARLERSITEHGDRFLERCFTASEREYAGDSRRRIEHLAARFAAKEATLKALGTGLAMGIAWREMEVRRERGREPRMVLSGRCRAIAAARGGDRVLLSLTHDGDYAMAQAMLVSEPVDLPAQP